MNFDVAFIGLGVMGYPMAGHLATAGHRVAVYNRSADKAERWCREHAGEPASSPARAAEGADFVMLCVGNDEDVRAVVCGENGALSRLARAAGSTLVTPGIWLAPARSVVVTVAR